MRRDAGNQTDFLSRAPISSSASGTGKGVVGTEGERVQKIMTSTACKGGKLRPVSRFLSDYVPVNAHHRACVHTAVIVAVVQLVQGRRTRAIDTKGHEWYGDTRIVYRARCLYSTICRKPIVTLLESGTQSGEKVRWRKKKRKSNRKEMRGGGRKRKEKTKGAEIQRIGKEKEKKLDTFSLFL